MLLDGRLPGHGLRLLPSRPTSRLPGHERQRVHEHDHGRLQRQHGLLPGTVATAPGEINTTPMCHVSQKVVITYINRIICTIYFVLTCYFFCTFGVPCFPVSHIPHILRTNIHISRYIIIYFEA